MTWQVVGCSYRWVFAVSCFLAQLYPGSFIIHPAVFLNLQKGQMETVTKGFIKRNVSLKIRAGLTLKKPGIDEMEHMELAYTQKETSHLSVAAPRTEHSNRGSRWGSGEPHCCMDLRPRRPSLPLLLYSQAHLSLVLGGPVPCPSQSVSLPPRGAWPVSVVILPPVSSGGPTLGSVEMGAST